ncbi:MAG TPA: ATP-binding protein, partial [Planctomycetota bacterium]|nr:ATP-binding protein [Planctomycetota bacterium]
GVLRASEPVLALDIQDSALVGFARDAHHLAALRALAPRSYVGVKMQSRGRTVGAINLTYAGSGRTYGRAEVAIAREIAARAALAIDNARLYEDQRRALDHLQRLQRLGAALARALLPADVFEAVAEHGLDAASATSVTLYCRTEIGHLECRASRGLPADLIRAWSSVPVDAATPVGVCVRDSAAVFLSLDELASQYPELPADRLSQFASFACIPIVLGGRAEGALGFTYSRRDAVRGARERALLEAIASHAAQALERARLFEAERTARAEAQRERRKLEIVLEQLPMAVAITDTAGGRLLGNAEIARIFRQPLPALGAVADYAVFVGFHPDGRRIAPEEWPLSRSILRGEVVRDEEIEIGRGDGTRGFIRTASAPIRDEQGTITGGVVVFEDVTERRQSAARLARTHALLEALVKAVPLAVILLERTGVVRLWNPAAERIFGWTASEVIGRELPIVPQHLREEFRMNLERVQAGESPLVAETTRLRKDGEAIQIALWTAPLRLDGGETQYLGVLADVTERKHAEARDRFLAGVAETLGRSVDYATTLRALARSIVPALADWCIVDMRAEDGRIARLAVAHADPSATAVAAALERRAIRADARCGVAAVIRTGKPELYDVFPDAVLVEVSNDERDLLMLRTVGFRSALTVPLLSGERVLGAMTWISSGSRSFGPPDLALAEEVARRAATAIERAELFRAAEAVNRAKDDFLAVLSHELRTPLTSMLGWTRLLRDGKLDAASSAKALEIVERNSSAQMQLINDILDVSRIVAGKLRVDLRPLESLSSVVEGTIEAARPLAVAKGVEIVAKLAERAGPIEGDSERLQQIVWNVLSNAVKFTPPGGHIRVECGQRGQVVELRVEDDGTGIPAAFLPYVFERFQQADAASTRRHGGLGLGLAIVKRLVELHAGTIEAHSAGEGRGATFTVRLPLATGDGAGTVDARALTRS